MANGVRWRRVQVEEPQSLGRIEGGNKGLQMIESDKKGRESKIREEWWTYANIQVRG